MAENDPLDQLKQATAKLRGSSQSGTAVMDPDEDESAAPDNSPLGRLRASTAALLKQPGPSTKVVPFSGPTARTDQAGSPMIHLAPPTTPQYIDASKIPIDPNTNAYQVPQPSVDDIQAQNAREDAATEAAKPTLTKQLSRGKFSLTQQQIDDQKASVAAVDEALMTGSRKMPIPAFTDRGFGRVPGVRTSSVGELTDLANENLNRPDIPKTRGEALVTGVTADAVKTLNDIFLSPVGIASAGTGAVAAGALSKAGTAGAEALSLMEEYQAMAKSGATAADLLAQRGKIQAAIQAASKAQEVTKGAATVGRVAAGGFGAQGVNTLAEGVQEKDTSKILSGLGQVVLAGSGEAAIRKAGGVDTAVKSATAANAAEKFGASQPVVSAERAAQIGSESVKPPALPEGTIGPKGEPLAPESPATLKAQVDALAKGTNKTVYFPKGTENLPAPPENAKVTVVPGEQAGAGTWYHTDDVKSLLILQKVKDGTFGQLLGNHQSKQEAISSTAPAAIVARDASGNEIKASLVDSTKPETVAAQAATLQRQFPKAEIGVEKPEDVIHERLGTKPGEEESATPAPVGSSSGATPERRSSIRETQGPDFYRTTLANNLRSQLEADAKGTIPLTDEARTLIQDRLADIKNHPFEKLEGESDMNRIKAATAPKMSREEAEAATETRKAGRNQRFGVPRNAPTAPPPPEMQPVIEKHAAAFQKEAEGLAQIDPKLAEGLHGLAAGKYHTAEHLKQFVQERVSDATTKSELTKILADESAPGKTIPAGRGAGSKSNVAPGVPVRQVRAAVTPVQQNAAEGGRKLGVPGAKRAKKITNDEIVAEAYKPGNIVDSYGGQFDKVVKFVPGDESKPYPLNTWHVEVIHTDKAGNPLKGEHVRAHRTPPEKKEFAAAKKRLEEKAAAPKFSPEVIDQAKHEIRAASNVASSFERPGRYFAEYGDQYEHMPSRSTNAAKGIHAGGTWYGVNSSKESVAQLYPWFGKMKGGAGKLSDLVAKEKGAEYDRLVNTVADHIEGERKSAAPVIAEFAPKLKSLSDEIDGHDEELSSTLAELAKGDGRGFKNLRQYIEEKVSNAEQARNFYQLIDAAAAEARQAGVEESVGSGDELRAEESERAAEGTATHAAEEPAENSEFLKAESVKKPRTTEKQNALPGFENSLDELKKATERVRGEKLTDEANRPLGDIENAAGEMERSSPLFRGTAASPQNEMFGEAPASAVGDRVQVNEGALKGKTGEVTQVTAEGGVYVRTDDNSRVRYVKKGDFEAAAPETKPTARPRLSSTTAYSNPLFDPEVWKGVLGYLEPSKAAGQADLRARTGGLARAQAVLQEKLKAERNRWRGRSDADMLAFADLVENGEADRKARGVALTPKTQAMLDAGKKNLNTQDKNLAATLRTLLDEGRASVQGLGTGKLQNFIENYFPHIWEQKGSKIGSAFGQVFGKRPLEGPKSFLKKREIPTTAEGFDKDLRPVTTNPVDMAVLKMHEMNRYVMAHRLLDDLKAAKTAQFVGFAEKPPEGWKPLDDRVFTVYGNPDIPVKEYYDEAVWEKLQTLADNLGIKHERGVNIGGTRLGYTAKGTNKVVTRFAGPEQVIAHEIGHQMDWKYGLKGMLVKTSPYREELRKLVDLKWEGKQEQDIPESFRKYIRKGEEKMAGMIEALVHAPDKFKKVAPQTYVFLQNFIKDKPELKPLLEMKPSMKIGVRTSTVNAGGMVIHGRYYAPEDVAQPLNRYVATGLRGVPVYDILRSFGNSLNQVQLGLSGFHLGTTSLNAVISQFALGAKQAARGEVLKAAKNILTAPAAPIRNLIQGGQVVKDYLRPDQAKKYAATANAVEQAGGRSGMGEEYIDNRIEKMMQSFANKKYFTGTLQSIPAAVEAQAIPVLKWTVPRMKLGAFHDLASDILDRAQKNDWKQDKVRSELQKAWDSIDNRFGQVVYDNLNWNKIAKDLAFIGVRSVGWNYGTWRELGGGVRDFAAQTGAALNGKGFDVTDRMAYSFALPLTIAALGALYMYAHTGKWPQSAKDYFYPKNGKMEEDGTEARATLPSYMKDVFAMSQHPVDTVMHKVNPAVGLITEMLENKDYYGNEIRNTDDPAVAQLIRALSHVGKSFLPFTLRNAQKRAQIGEKGAESQVENFLGITPSPRTQERTDAEAMAHDLIQRRSPAGAHTTAEQKKQERIFELEQEVRDKTLTRESLKAKIERGEVTEQDAITAIKRARTPGLTRQFKELTIPEALKVWDVASPKERGQLKEMLETKVQNGFPKLTREDQDRYRPLLRRALQGLPSQPVMGAPQRPPGPSVAPPA